MSSANRLHILSNLPRPLTLVCQAERYSECSLSHYTNGPLTFHLVSYDLLPGTKVAATSPALRLGVSTALRFKINQIEPCDQPTL